MCDHDLKRDEWDKEVYGNFSNLDFKLYLTHVMIWFVRQ